MRNLLKRYGLLITGVIIGALLTTAATALAANILSADYNANKVIFDGQELELDRPLISVVDDEMDGAFANYMPIRAVLEAMGYTVVWDGANSAVLVTTPSASNLTLTQTVNIELMMGGPVPVAVVITADPDFTEWRAEFTIAGSNFFAAGTFDDDMVMTVVETDSQRFEESVLPRVQAGLTDDWE